jgi:hypothetical protein
MKAIRLLLVSFFVLCVSTTNVVASNESDAAKIQRAMTAAPSSISAGATIRDVDEYWTVLREGEPGNNWTCFPGVPLNPGDKHPMCNDEVWMNWLDAVVHLFATNFEEWLFETDTVGYSYMLRGDALVFNNSPDPSQGDPDLLDQEGPHLMMLFPESVNLSELPRDPNAGGPYVMWGDSEFAPLNNLIHVMVPLTDRDR